MAEAEEHSSHCAHATPTKRGGSGIIVGAGAPKLPTELVEQLEIGGRLVVPVGSRQEQQLIKVVRTHDGFSVETLGGCRFVPLIGEGAWPGEGTTIE